jgi:hypothetical protein
MRVVAAIVAVLLLAGCAPPGPTAEDQSPAAITVSPLPEVPPQVREPPPPPPVPAAVAAQQTACAAIGGQLLRRGALLSCQRPTADAGRACRQASDCEGGCLARAGVCAPVTPLFGCQDLLIAPSQVERVCRD